jgi:hypothetical protein
MAAVRMKRLQKRIRGVAKNLGMSTVGGRLQGRAALCSRRGRLLREAKWSGALSCCNRWRGAVIGFAQSAVIRSVSA